MVRADHGELPDEDEDDARPEDPGLYYPLPYVLMTWREKDKGILPEAGGLNDQDWRLVEHDWPLVTGEYNRLSLELFPPPEDEQHPKRSKIVMPDPDEAGSFDDVLGE